MQRSFVHFAVSLTRRQADRERQPQQTTYDPTIGYPSFFIVSHLSQNIMFFEKTKIFGNIQKYSGLQ